MPIVLIMTSKFKHFHFIFIITVFGIFSCASFDKGIRTVVSNLKTNTPTENLTPEEKTYLEKNKPYLTKAQWGEWADMKDKAARDAYLAPLKASIEKNSANPCFGKDNLNDTKTNSVLIVQTSEKSPRALFKPENTIENFKYDYKTYKNVIDQKEELLSKGMVEKSKIDKELKQIPKADLLCVIVRASTIGHANPKYFDFIFTDSKGKVFLRHTGESQVAETPDSNDLWWKTTCMYLPAKYTSKPYKFRVLDTLMNKTTDYAVCPGA